MSELADLHARPGFDKDVDTAIKQLKAVAILPPIERKERARVMKELEQYRLRTEKLSPDARHHLSCILGGLGTTYSKFIDTLQYEPYIRYNGRGDSSRRFLSMQIHILIDCYDLPVETGKDALAVQVAQDIIDGAGLAYDAERVVRDTITRFYSDIPA
jgi:hypothetical protein